MATKDYSTSRLEFVEEIDINGHRRCLYRIVGTNIYLPHLVDCADTFGDLLKLKARHDDILIAGYPKCGTHWLWEVAGMLVKGDAEYTPEQKEGAMIEARKPALIDETPSPRVLNSHMWPQFLSPDFFEKKCKIIYLLRNPKDMLVSLYHHTIHMRNYKYKGRWDGFFEEFLRGKMIYGDWFWYVTTWDKFISSRSDLPIHVLHYEEMKKDPVKEISRLSTFLGTSSDIHLHQQIADRCSFKKMKAEKVRLRGAAGSTLWNADSDSLYRKGEVGDWKNWFTVAQNEILDKKMKDKLKCTNLKFTFEL